MFESKLEINGEGEKYIVCFYDPRRCNWDEIISNALARHKIEAGECQVLCLPDKKRVE